MGANHVGMPVTDLFASEAFYRGLLGFEREYRYRSINTPGLRTVLLRRGQLFLELMQREGAGPPPDGKWHLAVECGDVDSEQARLEAAGVRLLRAARTTGDGFREAIVADPDGHPIELSARVSPPPRPRIAGVLFDLDGTLVDSEDNYFEADRQTLSEHGIDLTREMKAEYIGRSAAEMMKEVRERFEIPADASQLLARKNELYVNLARERTPVFPAMLDFLERLRDLRLPLALATGSSPEALEVVLEHTGLRPFFQVVVAADEVPRGKPAPDLFVETARRLGVAPEEALVVEDSLPGVEAAYRAGASCLAIPYLTQKPLAPSFHVADLLFEEGMRSFDVGRAVDWVRERMRA